MGRIFGRLRSVQRRQNGSGIADAIICHGQAEALPCPPGVHGNVHRLWVMPDAVVQQVFQQPCQQRLIHRKHCLLCRFFLFQCDPAALCQRAFAELRHQLPEQRLGIAMALLGSPKLLILDEPTNGLDPAGIQEMRSLIASMPQTTGATVLISSHLLGEIEQMVDQVGILNHGRLLFEGSLQQLQKHSRGGILLRVLDVSKAAAVLQQQGVKAAVPADQPDTLQLPPLPDEALAALVCTLAESGVGVVGLTAQTKSLEDIFLSLTQTSGEVA